jgi:hypothetical protein
MDLINEDRTMRLLISATDIGFSELGWLKVIDCFRESSARLVKSLDGYAAAERLARGQLAERRQLF